MELYLIKKINKLCKILILVNITKVRKTNANHIINKTIKKNIFE